MRSLCRSLPGGDTPSTCCGKGHRHQTCQKAAEPKWSKPACLESAATHQVFAWFGTSQTWLGYLNISYSWMLAFRENKLILFHVSRNGPHQTAFLHTWLNKVSSIILGVLLLVSKTI